MTQVSESCQRSALEFSQNIGLLAVVGQFPGELSGREVEKQCMRNVGRQVSSGIRLGFR